MRVLTRPDFRENRSIQSDSQSLGARAVCALVVILAVAALVRFWNLDAGGLRLDEGYSMLQSETSVVEIIGNMRYEPGPPLYLVVLHLWRFVFGDGELVAKSLSALLGVIGVGAVFLAVRARVNTLAGLAAAGLVALHPMHLDASREIRGYALLFAALALADWAFARWQFGGYIRDLAIWASCMWVAAGCHHFIWYFFAVYVLFGALTGRLRHVLLACGAVLLAGAGPLIAVWIHLRQFDAIAWIPQATLADLASTYALLGGGVVAFPMVCGLIWIGLRWRGTENAAFRQSVAAGDWRILGPSLLQLLLPLVVFLMSYALTPMFVQRYLLICLIPMSVLFGAGVVLLRSWPLRAVGIALTAALTLQVFQYYHDERADDAWHVEQYARWIESNYQDGDLVLYTTKFTFTPAIALHPRHWDERLLAPLDGPEGSLLLQYCVNRPVRFQAKLDGKRYRRVWLLTRDEKERSEVENAAWFHELGARIEWHGVSGTEKGELCRYQLLSTGSSG